MNRTDIAEKLASHYAASFGDYLNLAQFAYHGALVQPCHKIGGDDPNFGRDS